MTSSLLLLGPQLVERAGRRLDGGRQRDWLGKVERPRHRREVGQHGQLGLRGPSGREPEHTVADGERP